jgi:antitoxin component of MazEF toxin-antitoxin module
MPKRKFDSKMRKVGNSYVVTIPKELINRFKIKENYYLALELDTKEIKKGG